MRPPARFRFDLTRLRITLDKGFAPNRSNPIVAHRNGFFNPISGRHKVVSRNFNSLTEAADKERTHPCKRLFLYSFHIENLFYSLWTMFANEHTFAFGENSVDILIRNLSEHKNVIPRRNNQLRKIFGVYGFC